MKCQKCNHENRDGTKFCESCGIKLVEAVTAESCASCGQANPSGFKFCKHCGKPRDSVANSSPKEVASPPIARQTIEPKTSKEERRPSSSKTEKKSFPWAIVIIVIAVLGGASYFFLGKSTKGNDIINSAQVPAKGSSGTKNMQEVTPSSFRAEAMPYISAMISAMQNNNLSAIDENAAMINGLQKPTSGDRKVARKFNDAGLAALKANNFELAISSFKDGVTADPTDQEVVNNLGYAYYQNGDLPRAKSLIEYTLSLAPLRTSAWTNYGVILFKERANESAINAYLVAFKYAKNQDKLVAFVEKQSQEDVDMQLRPYYSQVLTAISQRR
jgi:hypothetical protein